MNIRELLIEPIVYLPSAKALDGLSDADAHVRPPGANHSIAEIVAHLSFWQEWFVDRCEGLAEPMAQTAAVGWPAAPGGTWLEILKRFREGLERAALLVDPPSRLEAAIAPPIEFPPLAEYTVRDALVHVANHNAHHLGQIVLLRQVMGLWPPPAGSWTW